MVKMQTPDHGLKSPRLRGENAQYGSEFTHAQYQKIKKVYSIWICSHPNTMHQNSIT